jgi:hypothetical protein
MSHVPGQASIGPVPAQNPVPEAQVQVLLYLWQSCDFWVTFSAAGQGLIPPDMQGISSSGRVISHVVLE